MLFLVVAGFSYEGEDIPGGKVVATLEEAITARNKMAKKKYGDYQLIFKLTPGEPPEPVENA